MNAHLLRGSVSDHEREMRGCRCDVHLPPLYAIVCIWSLLKSLGGDYCFVTHLETPPFGVEQSATTKIDTYKGGNGCQKKWYGKIDEIKSFMIFIYLFFDETAKIFHMFLYVLTYEFLYVITPVFDQAEI